MNCFQKKFNLLKGDYLFKLKYKCHKKCSISYTTQDNNDKYKLKNNYNLYFGSIFQNQQIQKRLAQRVLQYQLNFSEIECCITKAFFNVISSVQMNLYQFVNNMEIKQRNLEILTQFYQLGGYTSVYQLFNQNQFNYKNIQSEKNQELYFKGLHSIEINQYYDLNEIENCQSEYQFSNYGSTCNIYMSESEIYSERNLINSYESRFLS